MSATVTQLIAIVLGSNALFELIKYLIERHDKKQENPERMALRALCEDRLDQMLHEWLHSDVRKADTWRIIENMYTGYHGLKGNGEIKKLYEEASELKTTE